MPNCFLGTPRLNWSSRALVLVGVVTLMVLGVSNVAAQGPCVVQSVNYYFPSTVSVGQQITAQTHLTATCVEWAPFFTEYSIRVDLTNISTGYVSTTTYQVGYAQTYIDQVFSNTATAPNSPGSWLLRIDVYIWGGSGQLLIHLTDYAKLPVG